MPRVQTTRTVKIVLTLLPVYLVLMMTLIIIKFVGSCRAAHPLPTYVDPTNAPPAAVGTNVPAAR